MNIQPDQTSLLQALALSDDTDVAIDAFEALTASGTEEVIQFYLHLLGNSHSRWIRNRAAMGLATLADSRAVEPLLHAINRPENLGANGTLVYALTQFDCRHLLKELFLIVFYQKYEAQLMALLALEDQDFVYSAEDVVFIRQYWEQVRLSPTASLQELGLDNISELIEEF